MLYRYFNCRMTKHSCINLIPVFQCRQLLQVNYPLPIARLVITEGKEQLSDTNAYDRLVERVKPQTTTCQQENNARAKS